MPGGSSLPDRSGIVFCGQHESSNAQISAKVGDLIVLGFEIPVIEVSKDKIQNRQLRAHVLDGVLAPVAEMFPTNGSIDQARKQVVNAAVSEKHTGRGMTFSQDLLGKRHGLLAGLGTCKRQVLAGREISRVQGHDIQESGFVLGVAKAAEVLDAGFPEVHKPKDSEWPS